MEDENLLTRQDLISCLELAKALTSELDSNQLFDVILTKLSELIPAVNWTLFLLDRELEELYFKICVGVDIEKIQDIRLHLGQGIAGQVALKQKPMIINDVQQSDYFTDIIDRLTAFKTKSVICVPLVYGGFTVGVLEAINPNMLDQRALTLLMHIADYTAIAVENTRKYNEIQTLAIQDNLTGLYNTRYLYKALSEIYEASNKTNIPFSLIFIDLDNFKNVVDTHGHLNGSLAIHEVAGTIKETLIEPEFGVSYGGDEFVIVLPGYNKKVAIQKAEDIRNRMNQERYLKKQGIEIKLSASFGVSSYPEDATNISSLLGLADMAMFNIKSRGKNAVGGI